MTTSLVTNGVWKRIKSAAEASRLPALVAVAYLGKGASKLLPLGENSRLVVDASEAAVKAGQTHPADLLKLAKRGVRVYGVSNLHAKLFVFGGRAFIGSANASNRSAHGLLEAVVETTDKETVNAARDYVRSLCTRELGPERLEKLQKLWRPPKFPEDGMKFVPAKKTDKVNAGLPGIRLIHLEMGNPPAGSEKIEEQGRRAAEKKRTRKRTHFVDKFHVGGNSFHEGDCVMQVVDEGDGPELVVPPGEVVETRTWSNGRQSRTFVFLEVPQRRRVRLDKLAKRIGRGAKTKLARRGRVSKDFSQRIWEAWRS